mgnify:FL=1
MQDSLIEKIKPYIKNYDSYLVGGYLRDLLSGEISPDRDIAIKCDNLAKLTKKIADELNGSFVELDPVNEIYRVVFGDDYIDFAKLLNNNLIDDIKRRDFTINAITYDINNEKFVDITGGKKDFEEKIIRTYKISNLSDDPLRTLRAIRFQAKLGFRIDDEIINFIKENNSLILNVAPERIHQELIKTFEGKFLIDALFSMDETGLLDVIFPFFKDIKKIPSNSHHHLDLFHHLIETTRNIRINKPELKLAAFIHDLAKPDCWTIEKDTGRHRFIGHDELGAKKVVPFLKKLKFSNKEIEYISKMVQFHIYPSALMKDENVTERAIIRFIRKIGDDTLDLLELARADRLSARGPAVSDEMVQVNLSNLEKLKEKYFEISPKLKEMPKLVDGNEIMQILNLKPSPKLKEIIDEIKELQLEGKINTKEDAINFLKNYKL